MCKIQENSLYLLYLVPTFIPHYIITDKVQAQVPTWAYYYDPQ